MSRQQGFDQYRRQGQYSRPESSRNWSEEAVRGSWESSYQRSMATCPPDRNSPSRSGAGVPRAAAADSEPRATNNIDSWLSQQRTQDPSRVIDAVSDFATPESSPAISDGSSTFPNRHAFGTPSYASAPTYRTTTRQTDRSLMVPPEYYATSSPSRTYQQSPEQGSSSRATTSHSTEYDLRGVGSFSENDNPMRGLPERKLKYRPLTNWFDMWLP